MDPAHQPTVRSCRLQALERSCPRRALERSCLLALEKSCLLALERSCLLPLERSCLLRLERSCLLRPLEKALRRTLRRSWLLQALKELPATPKSSKRRKAPRSASKASPDNVHDAPKEWVFGVGQGSRITLLYLCIARLNACLAAGGNRRSCPGRQSCRPGAGIA